MTETELLQDLRSRHETEDATGPFEDQHGRNYFRVKGLPLTIEDARKIVGDLEEP